MAAMTPVATKACRCHGQPMVFKGGHLRCPIRFKASQRRYQVSDKGRQRNNRHTPKRQPRKVYVTRAYSIYMPTVALAEQARTLIQRRKSEFIARQSSSAA